ncbi:MAG: ATP-binding cassette domain-containing protein [Deltaproteobacteria bacterium]|nr:MAG: ATP-binding cassette domain-containing protein [Deltaproteobacteria bacterium]
MPLRRLLGLALPEVGLLSIATIALLISSGIQLVYPQVVSWMIDGVVEGGDLRELDAVALLLVALFLVQAVFAMIRAWLFTVAGERVVARLRERVYQAILGQDIAFFDLSRTGELTNRLASDTTVLQNTVTVNVSMGLRFGIMGLGGIALMLVTSPLLTVIAMSVVPVVAIGAAIYGRVVRRLSTRVQDALADATSVAEESLSGVRTVRAFAREDGAIQRYSEAVTRSFRLAARRALAEGLFQGLAGFGGFGAVALVVWAGGRMVVAGSMSVGELTAFLLYTLSVAVGLGAISGLYGDFMRATGASRRIFHLLDLPGGLEQAGGATLQTVRGDLTFKGVVFAYPSRPEEPVLRGLDLHIRAGDVVALVGSSGAGKSTVASLVCRFYDPQQGTIHLDGQDLRTLDPQALRRHLAVVAQEPILFATSIAENIRYGRPNATEDEIERAARQANAWGFIEQSERGLQTQVGERGVRLSGGQKQRIAIARAILADPAVLILDEATSALDSESEHLVQEALDRLMRGRTTLVIAHRLSTVRDADAVAVLEQGRVVEQGSHAELMALEGGRYRALVERQLTG